MKKDTHPNYNTDAVITCACGTEHKVGSTVKELRIDICSNCHPFYTGKQKLVDTARRVEKFEAKSAKTTAVAKTRKGKTVKKAALKAKRSTKVGVKKVIKKIGSGRKSANAAKATKPKKEVKTESKADSK